MTRQKTITKSCSKCHRRYEIPNIRASRAFDYILRFYPCSFCGNVDGKVYVPKERPRRKYTEQDTCKDCFVPFTQEPHYAFSRCKRCYTRELRITLQKRKDNIP